ncbi:MAG: EF-P lysine aminoacylase GenX [Salinarimonas sp.]|nr:EF-P lysine aminoacylase GenX [Salinarimonas sp.]
MTQWWRPEVHVDRRPALLARNRIRSGLRGWFEAEGFVEVEPAILQISPGNEAHLHAFATQMLGHDGVAQPLYLHTSPEFACKKLLAAGESALFAFAPVFRNRERGPLHHPEFVMLEWYRANAPYDAIIADCAALIARAAEIAGATRFRHRGVEADPFAPHERVPVAQAFADHARIDLLASLRDDGGTDREALARAARSVGIRVAQDDNWADIFSRILVERIEPQLGRGRLTVLDRYPVAEAALARPCPDDPRLAERFEIYACGVELANGFGELTDPLVQRTRFEAEMDEKQRVYGERYPIDEDFLAALALMPPASGVALGLDRLVMLATGAQRIDQVIWTPVAESRGES